MALRSLFTTFFFLSASSLVQSFQFSVGNITQCDDIKLSWTGGNPPFQLLITPVFGTPRSVAIPPTAQGSFTVAAPFPKAQQMVLTMSDASGFGTGGTTGIITVGDSITGTACNTTDPGIAFEFQLNTPLQQCRPYTFSGYTGAVQPLTIIGLIPSGQSVVLRPPLDSTSFDWLANAAAGTSMIFLMSDSLGRQGGASNVEVVAVTDDRTCLAASALSSTFVSTITSMKSTATSAAMSVTSSATSSSSVSSTAPAPTRTSPASVSIGAIAGSAIGGLITVAVVVTLGLFFLRRREKHRTYGEDRSRRLSHRLRSSDNIHDSFGGAPNVYPYRYPNTAGPTSSASLPMPPEALEFNPYLLPPPPPPPLHTTQTRNSSNYPLSPPVSADGEMSTSSVTSIARHKSALAGETSYNPARFVLHTDLDDDLHPTPDSVVELPPQYSDRREPNPSAPPPLQDMRSQPDDNPSIHPEEVDNRPLSTHLAYLSE